MFYLVPASLEKEAEIIKANIVLMQKAFQDKCTAERQRIDAEKKQLLASRQWKYDIEVVTMSDGQWSILTKTAVNPVEGAEDNKQWSRPFKIVNGVRFQCRDYYKEKSWGAANSLIPQGLVEGGMSQQFEGW